MRLSHRFRRISDRHASGDEAANVALKAIHIGLHARLPDWL
jgi:hypothetical protein